jgi:hypothetical protein
MGIAQQHYLLRSRMTLKDKLMLIAAVAIQSSVVLAQPVSGSPEAAVQVGADFVQLLFGVGPDQVKVGRTSFNDNAATLQLSAAVNECDLALLKNSSANKYGWIVQLHTCKKVK